MANWADRIKLLRESLHLTQEEFAELIGASNQLVSQWETGKQGPTLCWERILQFMEDCPSGAETFRRFSGDTEIGWDRVQALLRKLGWDVRELAEFVGTYPTAIGYWEQGRPIGSCAETLILLLEVYSDTAVGSWPPALYAKRRDTISPERVKLLRLSHAMKQSQLADILHVDRSTITKYERGVEPSWCANLLLRVIETFPRAVDLLAQVPYTDEVISAERAQAIREQFCLTQLQFSHLLGSTVEAISHTERLGVRDPGCPTLIYLLLEKYPDDFIPLVEGLSSPGGQACPIW